ncbi:hypothetical protein BC832DRAFT_487306 [Gaertneriomyces semiglobifer]|nr:hypothetical protein BC832DRAFT_487306 [Gaertneriomyces semiglobifer]
MYVIKEQSLRSMYEKKTRKLTESTKTAEEKLWESYREAEARERTLRRHIAKLQKTLSQKESELDSIHRQVQSEHSRPPPRGLKTPPDASAKVAALQQKLSHYESLHVDNIMAELAEKTRLVEVLMAQRGEFGAGGLAGDDPSPRPKTSTGVPARRKLRTASARLSKPPMVIKTILPRRKGLGPYSDYSHPSPDDQPRQMDIVQMLQLENSSLREKLRQYEREREVGVGQSLQNSTRKSVGWNDQQVAARPLVGLESDQSDNEKDRPSGSAKSYRAVPKFVDAKPQTAVRESSRDNDIVIPSVLRTPNTSRPSSSQPQLRPLTRPRTSH